MTAPKLLFTRFAASLAILTLLVGVAHAQALRYTFEQAAPEKGTLSGPETLSVNGFQKVAFINRSDAELDVTLTRLEDGATLADYEKADKAINDAFAEPDGDARQPLAEFLEFAAVLGGVHLRPQGEGSAYLRLEPGRYVLSASSGGGPGEPYSATNLEVTVTEGQRAAAPAADFALTMTDHHFDFPDTMPAGESLWQVGNAGEEPHFALIFRLLEGKTAEDMTAWMTSFAGPPPVDFTGGTLVQTVTAGETYYTPVSLAPGTYVAVCPLPNLTPGAPHFADGMVDTFTAE